MMDDRFLVFEAAHDICAFEEELMWKYGWELAPAPPDTAPTSKASDDKKDPGADGDGEGPPSAEGSEGNDEAELIRAQGRVLHKETSFEVVFTSGKIIVLLTKKLKRLPSASVFNARSDSVQPTNHWKRVPYKMTPKTKVLFGGRCVKVAEAMGSDASYVWGYEDADCKMPRLAVSSTSAEELFWAPAADDLPVTNALLDINSVARFEMELKTIDGHVMLAPTGVVFSLKPRSIGSDMGRVIELSGQGDVENNGEDDEPFKC